MLVVRIIIIIGWARRVRVAASASSNSSGASKHPKEPVSARTSRSSQEYWIEVIRRSPMTCSN